MPVMVHWEFLAEAELAISAFPRWTLVVDFIPPKTTVKITALGRWSVSGPDGRLYVPDLAVMADYPTGALLGKVGGGSLGKSTATDYFPIGSYCVVDSGDSGGPLFVAVNAKPEYVVGGAPMRVTVSAKQ
jgi:hypothetical protein